MARKYYKSKYCQDKNITDYNISEIGNIIRYLRGNMTQVEFATLVGISQSTIVQYEHGRMPKIDILERIAEATGKRIRWVIEDMQK